MNKRIMTLLCLALLGYVYLSTQHMSFTSLSSSSASSETVTVTPTITVHFITQVLEAAHSPADGVGEVLYQQGIKYHINPAFALAVFHHESDYGRQGVATLTHSLGNIRCTSGWKCDPSGGYRWYPTWTDGVIDFYRVIQDVYLAQQCDTITKIIPIYAPSQDHNNVTAYIQAIQADLTRWQQGQV